MYSKYTEQAIDSRARTIWPLSKLLRTTTNRELRLSAWFWKRNTQKRTQCPNEPRNELYVSSLSGKVPPQKPSANYSKLKPLHGC